MINTITLTGRITKDLELKQTSNGTHVLDFTIAVDRNTEEGTDFIDVKAWRQSADFLNQFAQKGTTIGVVGKYRIEKFTGRDGIDRRKHFVVADYVQILNQPKDKEEKTVEQENKNFAESVADTSYANKFGSNVSEYIEQEELPFY